MHIGFLGLLLVLVVLFGAAFVLIALMLAAGASQGRHSKERSVRISGELERVDSMLSSGRITEEEAAELRDALSDQHPGSGGSLSERRLMKSRHPLLLGVCGGLADWLGWDPAIVRVLYVVATLMVVGFPGVLLYLILALVMPPHPEAEASSGRAAAVIVVVVFLFLLMALLLYAVLGIRMARPTRRHSLCPTAVRELRIDWPCRLRR